MDQIGTLTVRAQVHYKQHGRLMVRSLMLRRMYDCTRTQALEEKATFEGKGLVFIWQPKHEML